MKITYFGHSCYLLETGGYKLLFDPFITPNQLAKDINIKDISCDYILISHGHGDHIADAEEIAKNTGARIIANHEISTWFSQKGFENVHGMNIGGSTELPVGKLKFTNAVHSSSFPDGTYAGNPCGFLLQTNEGTFYYAGDTALTQDMKLLGQFADIDHAVLPIGDNYTMGIDDAIIAADFINCRDIFGMHYDTFPAIIIDREEAKNKFEAAGLHLRLPEIGETVEL